MADDILPFSSAFPEATEADWLSAVEKALKGKGAETLTRKTADGIGIRALYRESDFAAAEDPLGTPGEAPFLRGKTAAPDKWLPWDIRQLFTHPSPEATNGEILRDLERGVSSVEIALDCTGKAGVQITALEDFETALAGVRADFAGVALSHLNASGVTASALLGLWAETQENAAALKIDFNMDPLGALARAGKLSGGLDATFARLGAVTAALVGRAPAALWIVSAGILSVFSQAGDLLESALKRHFGVKDSGHIIPGHGGVMDRVDGLTGAGVLGYLVAAAVAGSLADPVGAVIALQGY